MFYGHANKAQVLLLLLDCEKPATSLNWCLDIFGLAWKNY